jgi:hypothetical protein
VLLTDTGAVKLADFGVSAVRKSLDERRQSVIGTPLWMAPEVIDNTGLPVPYDHRVDIWSLGITCLELAEMHPPLHDVHPMRALFLIPTRPPPTLEQPKKWSADFADFLSRCLVKEPDGRWSVDKLLAHPFLMAHHDGAVGAQLVELLREKKRADAALDAADAAAKSGAKDAPMAHANDDDDDDDDHHHDSSDDDVDDSSDGAPPPTVPPRRDSDDVSLESPRTAPSKASSSSAASKRAATKQASRTALPKDHMAFDEDESSSSSSSSSSSTSSTSSTSSAEKAAPPTRASIAAKTTARKAAKAKRRERFNTVKSDVDVDDAAAKSGGSSPHGDVQRSPNRLSARQPSFGAASGASARPDATPERRAQLDKAHRQALRQRTLEKRQGLAQTTLNARRNLQPEALIEKNELRKHMEVVRAKQRATAKERARIEKQNELELAEEQRRADAKLALFAKQAQARDRELSEKTVPKELEKQKRQHQTDIKAIAKQHESEMKQLQKSLREQGKSLIKMATEIRDDEPSLGASSSTTSAAATMAPSSSSLPSSSSSAVARSGGGEPTTQSANKKVLKARRELVAQVDATGLALAKSHELEGENTLELCRATRQQLSDVAFLRLTLCDKQRQVQLETLTMRAEAQVNVDKARQTREQANLSRLQRFTRDALESNQRFEREELNKRARLQAEMRLKQYKKGELRTVLDALQAQQRQSSDYAARKRDYKALRGEREAALIDEFAARQAALAEEHNEQLLAYHAYRHTRLEAMHLREMQKLLEMHQSQRLALELSFIDERQRLLQTWFDRRRVILDEDQSTMRSHIIQDQTADAGLRSRHHAARLEHLQKAQDQLRKMASEQSTDTTTQSWLAERLGVLERRRAELAAAYERDRETATAHEREQQQHMQEQHAAALAAHRTLAQTALDAVATDRKKLEAEYERDHSQLLTLQAEQQTLYHQQQHLDATADSLLAAAAEPSAGGATATAAAAGAASLTASNGAASPVAAAAATAHSPGGSLASSNGEPVATRLSRAVSVGAAADASTPDRGARGASPRVVDVIGGGRFSKRERRKSHHRERRGRARERAASHAEDLGAPDLHDSQSHSPVASPHPLGAAVSTRADLVDVNPMLQNELLSAKMEEIVRLQSEVAEQRQLREQQLQLQHIQQQLQQDGAPVTTVPKALSPRHRARQSHSPLQRRSSASEDDERAATVGKRAGRDDDEAAAELARLAAGFGGDSGSGGAAAAAAGSSGSRIRRRQHRSDRRSRRTKDEAAPAGEVVVVVAAAESELTDGAGAPAGAGATVWPWGKEHLERVRQRKLEMEQQQHKK